MKWENNRQSDNVEDLRGQTRSGGGFGGRMGGRRPGGRGLGLGTIGLGDHFHRYLSRTESRHLDRLADLCKTLLCLFLDIINRDR